MKRSYLSCLVLTLYLVTVLSFADEALDPRQYATGQFGVNLLKSGARVEVEAVKFKGRTYPIFNSFSQYFLKSDGTISDVSTHRFNAREQDINNIQGEHPDNFCASARQFIHEKLRRETSSCLVGLYNHDLHVTGLGDTPYAGGRSLFVAARVNLATFGGELPGSFYIISLHEKHYRLAAH